MPIPKPQPQVARALQIALAVVAVPLLGYIDLITGYELSFSIFYLAPISVAATVGGMAPGLGVSLLSAIAWGAADVLSGHQYSSDVYYLWNSLIRLGSFTVVTVLLAERRRAHARAVALARTDALTGLANGRHFDAVMDAELERCRRYGHPVSLAYIDLDNFKEVNDSAGHAAGDVLLQDMAAALRSQLRTADTAARLGGDEFGVLLPETDADAAIAAGSKIHRALVAAAGAAGYPVTASVGVVTCRRPPGSRDDFLRMADDLMYSVKKSSKNTVASSVAGLSDQEEPTPPR